MRITKYSVMLDKDTMLNKLVKESSTNYSMCSNFNSPELIVNMLNDIYKLSEKAEEFVYMLAFNTKQKLLGVFEVSHGTVKASLLNPREIFIRALLCGASNIVIAHNHPSGDTTPSKEDIYITKRMIDASKLIGLSLLDSIVIGGSTYTSLKEHNSNIF